MVLLSNDNNTILFIKFYFVSSKINFAVKTLKQAQQKKWKDIKGDLLKNN